MSDMPRRFTTEVGARRRRVQIARFAIAAILGISIVIVLVLLLLLRNPLLRVRSVKIEGLQYIPNEAVDTFLKGSVTGHSGFKNFLGMRNMLAWPGSFTKDQLKLLPSAETVTVEKNILRGSIIVHVKEREHEGVWCFENPDPAMCYWFDEQGLVTRTPRTEGSLILVVNDYARAKPEFEKPLIDREFLSNLFSIFDALPAISVTKKEIRLEDLSRQEVVVPTFDGPTLYFSLRFPASSTPAEFQALKTKTAITKLNSIDFRVPNRIYYK